MSALLFTVYLVLTQTESTSIFYDEGAITCGERVVGNVPRGYINDDFSQMVYRIETFTFILNAPENVTFNSCPSTEMPGEVTLRMWLYDSTNTYSIGENDTSTLYDDCPPVITATNLAAGNYTLRVTVDEESDNTEYILEIECSSDIPIATHTVIDIDTDVEEIPFVEELFDSMFFELMFFIIGYAVILIVFLIGMFCSKRIDDTGLKFKLVLFSVTLILEVFDVVSDVAVLDSMYSDGTCGVSSCYRQSDSYAHAMVPFIIFGGILSLFGNGLFFYLSVTGTTDDSMWKIESYVEIAKFWLEDIPILIILFTFTQDEYVDPNNPEARVVFNASPVLFVSLAVSAIDVVYSFIVLCGHGLCGGHYKEGETKQKCGFAGCTCFTTFALLLLTALTWIRAEASFNDSSAVYSMDGYCAGTRDYTVFKHTFERDICTNNVCQYSLVFDFDENASTAEFQYIDTPYLELVFYPDNCTYTQMPQIGQCTDWFATCFNYCSDTPTISSGNLWCEWYQGYHWNGSIPNLCADLCLSG